MSSDAARWRALMPQVRTVAYQLASQQRLRITQRGQPINLQAASARGAIRLTVWQMGAVVATADIAPQQALPIDAQAPSE